MPCFRSAATALTLAAGLGGCALVDALNPPRPPKPAPAAVNQALKWVLSGATEQDIQNVSSDQKNPVYVSPSFQLCTPMPGAEAALAAGAVAPVDAAGNATTTNLTSQTVIANLTAASPTAQRGSATSATGTTGTTGTTAATGATTQR